MRLEPGQALIALGWQASADIALIARGTAGSRLHQMSAAQLKALAQHPETAEQVVAWIDRWVGDLAGAIALERPAKHSHMLDQGLALDDGEVVHAHDAVVWVRHQSGSSLLQGRPELPRIEGDGPFPLAGELWLRSIGPTQLKPASTLACAQDGTVWSGLERFHHVALICLHAAAARQEQAQRLRLQQIAAIDRQVVTRAIADLASVLESASEDRVVPDNRRDPLLAASRRVGEALGIAIAAPRTGSASHTGRAGVEAVARASRVRVRQVALRGDWWRGEGGPLLAFQADEQHPVALLPARGRRYICYDPATGTRTEVTAELAAALDPFAYTFFRRLPERAVGARELLRLGLRGAAPDMARVALAGAAVGFLGLALPIVTGVVFDSIIPAANQFKLLQLSVALVVAAIATGMFQLVRSIAILRIETRMSAAVQAAVWDRVLNLPMPFFRRYSAGDLAARVGGIEAIRQTLTGVTVSTILTGLFSLFNFGLLLSYDAELALIAGALVLVAAVVSGVAGAIGLGYERSLSALQASISGLVLQIVSGVAKLRVSGAETRAFGVWAKRFASQRRLTFRVRMVGNALAVFNAAFPTLALIALFAAIAAGAPASRSTGTILAFVASFSALLAAALSVSGNVLAVLRIIPLFENVRPVLTTPPEIDEAKIDPGELTGAIEISHVSFRYAEDGPPILREVSLRAQPGQFIAVVGPSGSGKSTLLRLLLGFETPEAGSIYYDGQDLTELDVQAVRRQIGVVLQNGKLMPGDIYTNIVGASLLTLDDAWEAARMAGLDEDIRQLPMGMHTVISEAGSTFSGGQRQRLMIARALVSRPRILLFDEATSALDNHTQAIVSRSLEQLRATRIVIAHRLSTIVNADRIYVVDTGRVAQVGSYVELAEQDGPFRDLIRRQLL
jgi:ATP-binding cassette subfamily C protein